MPKKSGRPCKAKSCAGVARGKGPYCKRCVGNLPAYHTDRRESASRRGYDRRWRRLRKAVLSASPLCVDPFENHRGYPVPAVVVDHIKPLNDGGTNHPANLQTLCKSCHDKKTQNDVKARKARQASGVGG